MAFRRSGDKPLSVDVVLYEMQNRVIKRPGCIYDWEMWAMQSWQISILNHPVRKKRTHFSPGDSSI